MRTRPYILTIAGFDPSSGAGITADIKTIEQLKGYGLGVCTANTVQSDLKFEQCYWMPIAQLKEQIAILYDSFKIEYVKIGIVENIAVLKTIISSLIAKNPNVKIIIDPVLTSSTAYEFHKEQNMKQWREIWDKVFLVTPNYNEIQQLYPGQNLSQALKEMCASTNVFLKGGHKQKDIGVDELYMQEGKHFVLKPKKTLKITEKHGSGCILATAITTYLAQGYPLLKACYKAKRYTEKVLSSNTSLLGYHN
ncbi:hydroxymethylpyrimidine/phosphomethylpyrimidine kinase [Aquimarina rhabdastrellae]